jgi:hypothetical protein
MSVLEMRMLRWISGNTWKHKIHIRNDEIRLKIGVVPIDEKMKDSPLEFGWWFSEESN